MTFGRANSFLSFRAPVVASALALALAAQLSGAMAEGGQTEVAKTVPAAPQNVQQTPPAASTQNTPAPSDGQAATKTQQGSNPQQPVSPIGGAGGAPGTDGAGANWQANLTQQPAPNTPQESNSEIITKVNAYFNGLTNLQGTFLQTDPDTKQKHGKFFFAKPGKVRFDYGAPSKLKIISDGTYLAIEDHDLQTSDRYPLEMTPFRLLLSQTVDLANEANIIAIDQGPDAVVLTLEDKKSEAAGRIRLFFTKPDMRLKEWIITDQQGLDTRVELTTVEENKQVAAGTFQFSKDIGFKNSN